MELVSNITEVQFNFVKDPSNINSREAVCRLRINGDTAWVDLLQGRGFFEFLRNKSDIFAAECAKYHVTKLYINMSKLSFRLLKRALKTDDLVLISGELINLYGTQMYRAELILLHHDPKYKKVTYV